jgi:hypothetical protein
MTTPALRIRVQHQPSFAQTATWQATVQRKRRLLPGWTHAYNANGYAGRGSHTLDPDQAAINAWSSFTDAPPGDGGPMTYHVPPTYEWRIYEVPQT